MEEVLDLYQQPYDPDRPVVCMDESNKQLTKEVRPPRPMKRGRPRRKDPEYERHGVGDIFLFVEPLAGQRFTAVTSTRKAVDWAQQVKHLLTEVYPQVSTVRLVMDNLNTHGLGALYEAFPAREAHGLASRLELHYTPLHGSWLNIAEIELSALSRQCLGRRIPDLPTMAREVSAWTRERNPKTVKVDGQFTTADARIKLKRPYPKY